MRETRLYFQRLVKARYRPWSDLPLDLLEGISDHLSLIDFLSFRSVCMQWRSASWNPPPQPQSKLQDPWILFFHKKTTNCILYERLPYGERYYTTKISELQGASCISSKEGWLLFRRGRSFFFFYPFTRLRLNLPSFRHSISRDMFATFSSPPTSPDWVLFLVYRKNPSTFEIATCKRGDRKWLRRVDFSLSSIRCVSFTGGLLRCYNKERVCDFDTDQGFRMKQWQLSIFKEDSGLPLDCRWDSIAISSKSTWRAIMDSQKFADWWLSRSEGRKIRVTSIATTTSCEDDGGFTNIGLYLNDRFRANIQEGKEVDESHVRIYRLEKAGVGVDLEAIWIEPRFLQPPTICRWSL